MKFIIGKKIAMTQVWRGDRVRPVTRVQAGPCTVLQVKTAAKDGYEAVQVGFGTRKPSRISRPQAGHTKGLGSFAIIREFRTEAGAIARGQVIDVTTFADSDRIAVAGLSKGKGFQGVVRRHGFKGSKKTHGNKDQLRMPGSIGAGGVQHVQKGRRMAGRMGGGNVTVKWLEIVGVDPEKNEILISGAIPGARNGYVTVWGEGDLKTIDPAAEKAPAETAAVPDEIPAETAAPSETVNA
jgi:large subunit ribosomal protein L3